MMTAFVWPYPLLLAAQQVIRPDAWLSWMVADLVGLGLVWRFAARLQKALGARARSGWVWVPIGVLGWPLLLGVVQLLAIGLALALGWPVGE